MMDAQDYLIEQARGEPLLKLIERVQRDAFEAGYNTCAEQIMDIADASKQRVAATTAALIGNAHHA